MNKYFKLWTLIRDTIHLNIIDCNYVYSSKRINFLSLPPTALPSYPGWRLAIFFWKAIQSFFRGQISFPCEAKEVPLFIFGSTNEKYSLEPIWQTMKKVKIVGMNIEKTSKNGIDIFPIFLSYFFSLPFLPLVLYQFLKADTYTRKTFKIAADFYWIAYGHYLTARLFLQQLNPSCLVMSNDHTMWNRVFLYAAKRENVPVIYVQHASVTENFPPLAFDYALLEGKDALQKYDQGTPTETQIFLVGMPKMDQYFNKINTSEQVHKIGICTNALDLTESVEKLLVDLKYLKELLLVLRPHPSDVLRRESLWQHIAKKFGMTYSNPKEETAFSFLTQVDAIISGDSSILLEAALLNVLPIYYDFSGQNKDHYKYVKNGLAEYFRQPEEMIQQLEQWRNNKPNVRDRTQFYCINVNTPFDGCSSELASKIIDEISVRNSVDMTLWRRVPNVSLTAYELSDF